MKYFQELTGIMGCVSDQVVMWYYFAFTGRILSYYAIKTCGVSVTYKILSLNMLVQLTDHIFMVCFFVLCISQDAGILCHIHIMFVESCSIQ